MDYAKLYNEEYYTKYIGDDGDYGNREKWYPQFREIAKKIYYDTAPKTVLDVGCAMGYLVEALREFGVTAYGIDISEYAISQVAEDVKPYCKVHSILDGIPSEFPQKYDLVITIEVMSI